MYGNRLCYLLAVAGCGMFYLAYGEWFSWLALLLILGLPWLSLALSLPAILSFRAEPGGADVLPLGEPGEAFLLASSHYPIPPFRGRLRLQRYFDGQSFLYSDSRGLPTDHCGAYRIIPEKVRVCDYLGLFAFPVRRREEKTLLVRPLPLPLSEAPDLSRCLPRTWVPKPGGGFAENHDLRLYRPGDSLNQVHWKLSAKTGKLTIREPLLPQRGQLILTMTLRGTPEELDRKLGRLLWLGAFLLNRELAFTLQVLTGNGVLSLPIASEPALEKAADLLLRTPAAREGSIRDYAFPASWQYHIGGEADEV